MTTSYWTTRAQAMGIRGAVTIESVHVQRGWDARDHMIDESAARALAGRECRSLAAAVAAADRTTGRHSAAVTMTVAHAGRRYVVDTSAGLGIPGRHTTAIAAVWSGQGRWCL